MKSENHNTTHKSNRFSKKDMISWIVFFAYRTIYWFLSIAIFYRFIIEKHPIATQEAGLILLLFFITSSLLSHRFRSLNIGEERISDLFISQAVSICLSYIGAILLFLILDYESGSVTSWILSMLTTLAASLVWTIIGNQLYFKINPALNTLVIYGGSEFESLLKSIKPYPKKFKINTFVPVDNIYNNMNLLLDYDAVIMYRVNIIHRGDILQFCVKSGLKTYVFPEISDLLLGNPTYGNILNVPMISLPSNDSKIAYKLVKRFFDILLSSLALVILSPLMIIVAILIKLEDGGSVFFKQVRLTKDFKKFNMYKFRSMHENADADGIPRLANENDSRITKIGEFIRKTKIDELPQLFNIIKGDMSIVGPRPEALEIAYQDADGFPEFHLRLLVKGGLTGYAQVYGKYNTKPFEKLQMDLLYIANQSILMDIKLIFATLKVIFLH